MHWNGQNHHTIPVAKVKQFIIKRNVFEPIKSSEEYVQYYATKSA